MRSSILALLAGPVIALASPALRLSVTVDEGIGPDSPSQHVLTTTDPGNLNYNFVLSVPNNDLVASPQFTEPGQLLRLNPQTGAPTESFTLQNGALVTTNFPPLVVFSTSTGGPPVLALGPPSGGNNLQPLKVGAFPSGGGLVLLQFDPSNGSPPKPFSALGPPVPGVQIALQGGPPITLQVQQTG